MVQDRTKWSKIGGSSVLHSRVTTHTSSSAVPLSRVIFLEETTKIISSRSSWSFVTNLAKLEAAVTFEERSVSIYFFNEFISESDVILRTRGGESKFYGILRTY